MDTKQNNNSAALVVRKTVVFVLVSLTPLSLAYNHNHYQSELLLILAMPFLFGVVLIIRYGQLTRLIYGLPLINLLAIMMWLYCLYEYQKYTNKGGEIELYIYLIPLGMILVIIYLLLEYTDYLLKRSDDGAEESVPKKLDKILFDSNINKSDCSFESPSVILFSSFALFISITILFGFALAFNDIHLRDKPTSEIGLYINPKTTISIQRSNVFSQVEKNQSLYGDIQQYVLAIYALTTTNENNSKQRKSDLDKNRKALADSINGQYFPRSIQRNVSDMYDENVYTRLQNLMEKFDAAVLAFYKQDPIALNQRKEAVSQALFLAVDHEAYSEDELLGYIANHFVFNSRRSLYDQKTDFLVAMLDLHQHIHPISGAQTSFTLENGEHIKSSVNRKQIEQRLDDLIQGIAIKLRDTAKIGKNHEGLTIQILASATDYTQRGGTGSMRANKSYATIRLEEAKELVNDALKKYGLETKIEVGNGAALVVEKGTNQRPESTLQLVLVRGEIDAESERSKKQLLSFLKSSEKLSRLSLLEYMYFSIYTITTTGYGDIVPVSQQAKFIVSIENLVEVFFVVIFFGILIALLPNKNNDSKFPTSKNNTTQSYNENEVLSESSGPDAHISNEASLKVEKKRSFFSTWRR